MYEITIERTFSAAHALRLPDHTFEALHGHDWRVAVTVVSDRLDPMDTVMDFHELERLLEAVIGTWRNGNLNEKSPFKERGELVVNPSAERVAEMVCAQISAALAGQDGVPSGVRVRQVAVGEAPGCTALFNPPAGRHRED